MIQRIRNYQKKEPSRNAQKIFIVCEGNATEPNYFGFFAGLSSNLSVIPIPSEDGKSDPLKLKEWVQSHLLGKNNAPDYKEHDLVWFVVDTDEWQKQGKIAALKDFCSALNAQEKSSEAASSSYDMWNVAQSNPQFEIWHYYHIYSELPDSAEVAQFASFKEFVNSKIQGGFDFHVHPVYVEDAIKNALSSFTRDSDGYPSEYSTEVYKVCQQIVPFVKNIVDVMKKKAGI